MNTRLTLAGILITAFLAGNVAAAEPDKPAGPAAEKPAQKPATKPIDCSKAKNQQKKACQNKPVPIDCTLPDNRQKEDCKKQADPLIAPVSGIAPTPPVTPKPPACDSVSSTLTHSEGVRLATASGCSGCHTIAAPTGTGYGPDWTKVARQYRCEGKVGQIAIGVEARLINKIAQGGSGVWGHNAMPANSPRISDANIKKLADFILTLP